MGSAPGETGRSDAEGPQHQVKVASFLLGKTEVTQGQWRALMGSSSPSRFSECGDQCPVENVSWDEALDFLLKLSETSGQKYRLPSEAEWEYAARAGTQAAYWWGSEASRSNANYGKDQCCEGWAKGADKWVNSAPVAQFPPNPFGLYDMNGNVLEWVQDVWHENYSGAPSDGSPWNRRGQVALRVIRGGGMDLDGNSLRSAARSRSSRGFRSHNLGFRVARSLQGVDR